MATCPECSEPLDDLQCHHHNTFEDRDERGTAVVQCEDCPAWWSVNEYE